MFYPSISLLTITEVSLTLFLYSFFIGEGVRRIIRFKISNMDEKIIIDLALGTALMPILVLLLSPLKIVDTITLLVVLLITLFIMLYNVKISWFKNIFNNAFAKLKGLKASQVICVCALCFSWLLRLLPTIGMYVHPGDDAKMHSILVKRVIEEHSYPSSWRIYAPIGLETYSITYLMGFHGICSIVYFLLFKSISVEQIVFLVSQNYNWLLSLSLYFLAKKLFTYNVAMIAAVVLSILPFPLGMVTHGGNAELPALFLMFILLSLILEEDTDNLSKTIAISFMFSGMLLTHITVSLIFILFLLPHFICCLIKIKKSCLKRYAISLFTALVLLIIHKHNLFIQGYIPINRPFSEYFSILWWEYDLKNINNGIRLLFQSTPFSVFSEPILLFYLSIILGLSLGLGSIFFVIFWSKSKSEKLNIMLIDYWFLLLLLLLLNNPIGPYFVRFPGWYVFIPGKILEYCVYVASILIGFACIKIYEKMCKSKMCKIIALILSILSLIIILNADLYLIDWARNSGEPITTADLKAFEWINQNIPQNSTFLVTDVDAGQWIPIFTGRRVIPMFLNFQGEILVNETSWKEVYLISGFHYGDIFSLMQTDPDSQPALRLIKKYGINYVYLGAKKIYGRNLDLNVLEVANNYVKIYEEEGVKIYQVKTQNINSSSQRQYPVDGLIVHGFGDEFHAGLRQPNGCPRMGFGHLRFGSEGRILLY